MTLHLQHFTLSIFFISFTVLLCPVFTWVALKPKPLICMQRQTRRGISRQIQWKLIQHVKAVWTPLSRCHPLHPPSPHPHLTSIHSSAFIWAATLALLHLTSQEWNRSKTSWWWWSSEMERKCSSLPVHPPTFSSIHPSIMLSFHNQSVEFTLRQEWAAARGNMKEENGGKK